MCLPSLSTSTLFARLQADRQGRAGDFAAAYAKSELKAAADAEIERQLALASDLGEPASWPERTGSATGLATPSALGPGSSCHPQTHHRPPPPITRTHTTTTTTPTSPRHELADEATRADLAVTRETVTPFWWALRTLLKYRTTKNYK